MERGARSSSTQDRADSGTLIKLDDIDELELDRREKVRGGQRGRQPVVPVAAPGYDGQMPMWILRELEAAFEHEFGRHLMQPSDQLRGLLRHAGTIATSTDAPKPSRDAQRLRRRLEVVRLPVSVLHRHGFLKSPPRERQWRYELVAVGIGPDGEALAV